MVYYCLLTLELSYNLCTSHDFFRGETGTESWGAAKAACRDTKTGWQRRLWIHRNSIGIWGDDGLISHVFFLKLDCPKKSFRKHLSTWYKLPSAIVVLHLLSTVGDIGAMAPICPITDASMNTFTVWIPTCWWQSKLCCSLPRYFCSFLW